MLTPDEDNLFLVEKILISEDYEDGLIWTAPRWARKNDVVLFYCAKTGNVRISQLRKQLREDDYYNNKQHKLIETWIEKANSLFKTYGGRILAVGKLSSDPYYLSSSEFDNPDVVHYNMNMWADIGNICVFENMIHITQVNSYISIVRQAAITPLFGEAYEQLKIEINKKNKIPTYYAESVSVAMPLYKIKADNWLEVNCEHGRKYRFESQFRTFYVDYFLKLLSDNGLVYRECPCLGAISSHPSYADNVILLNGYYLPVEVKLNINIEKDIVGQVKKYCNLKKLFLNSNTYQLAPIDKTVRTKVLIFDLNNLYWYDDNIGEITEEISLDEVQDESDIKVIKAYLYKLITE